MADSSYEKSNNHYKSKGNNEFFSTSSIPSTPIAHGKVKSSNYSYGASIVQQPKSIGNPNFKTLPLRGSMRAKDPGTKTLINSDTYFQTRTLLYADHEKSPINYSFRHVSDANSQILPTNSMDSLNSSTDPEIVSALDQIASEMGLIDEKVLSTSVDPVNYLLKTRSFSEKISINKNVSSTVTISRRVQSLVNNNTESFTVKTDVKKQSQLLVTPVLRKKENSFRKIMQRLSPKGLRRTKSSPPTIINNSFYDVDSNEHVMKDIINEKSIVVDVGSQTSHKITSSEIISPDIRKEVVSDKVKDISIFSDHSKRLLNSISIDRVEDPKGTFLQISKNRISENFMQDPCQDTPTSDNQIEHFPKPVSDNSESHQTQSDLSFENTKRPITPSNPSYIHISLSAFGYGPNPSIRRSFNSIRHRGVQIPNASGDQSRFDNEAN